MKILDNQIEKLKNKGLIFKDEESAKKIILRENYKTITNGYTDIFLSLKKKNHEFNDESYFEELYAIYLFDRDLKNLLFSYINIIETNIKSYIAYMLTDNYGNKNILRKEFFDKNTESKFQKLKEQIGNNIERSYYKHININNENISPLVLINFFTFGNIVNLEQILKPKDKTKLEKYTGISSNNLEEYLRVLNVVRNICAHGDILFNLKIYAKLDNENNKFENHKLHSIIKILKKMLSKEDFQYFFNQFENLLIYLRNKIDNISYANVLETIGISKNNLTFHKSISNNSITYQPNPIHTKDIVLNNEMMNLAEKLAENAHDIWAIKRINEDWKYGTIRDDNKKTTPDLVTYQELSESEKTYDRETAIETLKVIKKLGFTIKKERE